MILLQCGIETDSFSFDQEFGFYSYKTNSRSTGGSVTLASNFYDQNFAGTDQHIVSIEGFQTVVISSETYQNNENYLPQSFIAYSQLYQLLQEVEKNKFQPIESLQEFKAKAHSILRIAASTAINLSNVTFNNNWVADLNSYPEQSQSNALSIQDLFGVLSLQSVLFQNNQGSGGSALAQIASEGYRSGLLVFQNVNLSHLVFEEIQFLSNKAYFDLDNPISVVPCLFNIDRDILGLDSQQVAIKNLKIVQNRVINVDFAAKISLENATFPGLTIKSNTAKNILRLVYPTSLSVFDVQDGQIESNIVTGGSVFSLRESSQITFPTSTTDNTINFNLKNVAFTTNINLEDPQSITSCIEITKSTELAYPWMHVTIQSSNFTNNVGMKTNSFHFDQSMVSSWNMDSVRWKGDTAVPSSERIAQVIYSTNPRTQIKVTNSKFECQNTAYVSTKILKYDKSSTAGRPGLFRIKGSGSQNPLPFLNPESGTGTLDPGLFLNKFSGNSYQNCNMVFRGAVFYLEQGAQVSDTGSIYQSNSALEGGVAFLSDDQTYLHIQSPLSVMSQMRSYYGAILFATHGATAHLTQDIEIAKCQAYEGVVAFLTERARIVLVDSILISNNIANKQALVSSVYGTQFLLDGVTFQDNIVYLESPIIFIEQAREQYYLVDGSVAVAYGESNALVSYLFNTTVIRTEIKSKGRLISVIQSALRIENFISKENYPVEVDTQGIYMSDAEVQIKNGQFFGQQSTYLFTTIRQSGLGNIYGSFISVYGPSNLNVDQSSFKNGRATQGGCISIFGDANVTIGNSDFNLCAGMLGGAIYADGFANLNLFNTTFQNNIGYKGSGQNIYAIGGTDTFQMDSCELTSHQNSVFLQSSKIEILNCQFKGDGAARSAVPLASDPVDAGGLLIQNSLSVVIDQCTFQDLYALNGGAIYITESTNVVYASNQILSSIKNYYQLSLTNLVIRNCYASQNGGGLYLKDTSAAVIHNATITANATQMGGGIYFYCSPASLADQITNPKLATKCGLDLQKSNFDDCGADQGGAIYWNFIEPSMGGDKQNDLVFGKSSVVKFGTNTFTRCVATSYGPQISAVGQQLVRLESVYDFQQYYNQSNPKRQIPLKSEDYNFISNYSYDDVQSGGSVPITYFAVIDKYGQVVQTNQGKKIRFNLDQDPKKDSLEFPTRINGMMDFYSMYGVYNMSSMEIYSQPGINIPVSITVQSIDLSVPSVRKFLSTNLKIKTMNSTEQYRIVIQLKVRACIEGEGLSASGACYTCPFGTFLLSIPTTQTACQVCQTEKSICLGGSVIGPKPGYWRMRNSSYEFLPCKEADSCLGMNSQMPPLMQGNLVGLCDKENGYSGVLCSACLPGFKRKGNFQCSKCTKLEALFVVGSFVLIGIGLCVLVKTIIQGAASPNNTYSVFTKILMNHMQMLLIISSFDMAWSEEVLLIFNIAAPIQQITSSLVSFDCWMDTRDFLSVNVYEFYAPKMEFRIIYQKMLIMAALPILVTVGSYLFWFIVLKIQRRMEDHDTNFIATLVLLLFLVHPSVTQSMINMFDCQTIDGESRLTVDLQVTCWEGMHTNVAYYIALPCLLVWGIGIPITVFFMMRKDSDKLDTIAVKRKFGFLYNGYKRHNYFWEIVIMYRKVICIFIAVFLKKTGIVVQALILLIVLVLFMQGNATNRPFSARALNDIENLSLSTQIATIYCGIFFISSKDPTQSSFDKSKDFYLTANGKTFFFAVIALCNLAFILLWLTKFVAVLRVLIKEEYPRLYVVLFLCGRSDKMSLETVKRARDVKKESIIESIEAVTLFMSKMKSMYANNVFYQDHNRYLKLLYYIESERQQIDLTEKRHNYYIQGQIARHRKFDPEVIREAQDQRALAVGDQVLYTKEAQNEKNIMQKSLMKLGGLFKLKRTQLISKVDAGGEQQDQVVQEPQINILSGLLGVQRRPNIKALEGKDLLDISETQLDQTVDGHLKKSKASKKKKRKANQADLEATYMKSRNQLAPLKIEKIERVRANEINQLDGSRILPELPEYLRGFTDSRVQISPERTQEELKLQTVESFEDRLHLMRKLTARMNEQESPGKSLTKSRTNFSQSGATEAQTQLDLPPESQTTGIRDLELANLRPEDLPVFKENTGVDELRRKIDFDDDGFKSNVNVVRGGGGQVASQEIQPVVETRERMRPLKGFRHELKGDQVVEVYANKKGVLDSIGDNDLIITIFDDDDERYGSRDQRSRSGFSRANDKTIKVAGRSLVSRDNRIASQANREYSEQQDITESLHTDPSMVDYDSNGGSQQEENAPNQATKRKEQQQKRAEVHMGEGLGGLNFHPQITPGLIFDNSHSGSENDSRDNESSQSSGRDSREMPEIDELDFNDRTRN